jgi:hypothetical protein
MYAISNCLLFSARNRNFQETKLRVTPLMANRRPISLLSAQLNLCLCHDLCEKSIEKIYTVLYSCLIGCQCSTHVWRKAETKVLDRSLVPAFLQMLDCTWWAIQMINYSTFCWTLLLVQIPKTLDLQYMTSKIWIIAMIVNVKCKNSVQN